MEERKPNPVTIRVPGRTRALIAALRAKTGMTFTQTIIQAVECLAEKYNVKPLDNE